MTKAADTSINLDADQFQFTNSEGDIGEDGPLLMKVILDRVEPATRLGIELLEDQLLALTLSSCDGNLSTLLDSMEDLRQQIRNRTDNDPPRYEKLLFTAILSGNNNEFNVALQSKKNKWDDGSKKITAATIRSSALKKWNNMKCPQLSTGPPLTPKTALTTEAPPPDSLAALAT